MSKWNTLGIDRFGTIVTVEAHSVSKLWNSAMKVMIKIEPPGKIHCQDAFLEDVHQLLITPGRNLQAEMGKTYFPEPSKGIEIMKKRAESVSATWNKRDSFEGIVLPFDSIRKDLKGV